MTFKKICQDLIEYQKKRKHCDFKILNIGEEENGEFICKFLFKSCHTGPDVFGEMKYNDNGIIELCIKNKESIEKKKEINIITIKKSSVCFHVGAIGNKQIHEIQTYISRAAVYLKREYKKNFN